MPSTLLAGTVLTGTVISVQILPGSDLPRTEVVLAPDHGAPIPFILPGANGGPPAAVAGVPVVHPGQTWTVDLVPTPIGRVPRGLGAGMRRVDTDPTAPPWNLNGNHLRDEWLPWPVWLNQDGASDLGLDATQDAVTRSLDQWSQVGCSSFAFDYQGLTALGIEEDGVNVLAWEHEAWDWGDGVIGMNITRFGFDDDDVYVSEVDILFNGVDFTWTDSADASGMTVNIGSILTHELGHTTGMDHEYSLLTSTMYLAYYGGDWMATLSGDDQRGLCENYPSGTDACVTDADCAGLDASERHCVDVDGIKLCDEVRDPVGSPCALTDYNCEEACVITTIQWSDGYCTQTCTPGSCDAGQTCLTPDRIMPLDAGPVCVTDEHTDTGPTDTGPTDTGPTDTGADQAPPQHDEPTPAGCGCATATGAGPWPLLPLFLLTWRRRRAAPPSPAPQRLI